jgi:small subunit ribosomal protein S14
MTRTSLIVSHQRRQDAAQKARAAGKKAKFPTRVYNRCKLCSRRHGFMRFFSICRCCFRELASNGEIPGVTKSSW